MWTILARFRRDASGATAIEYGLIAALVAVALMAGARSLGGNLNAKLKAIATAVGTTVP